MIFRTTILLIALLLAFGFSVAMMLRRWRRTFKEPPLYSDFDIVELAHLHRDGRLTAAEFEKARQIVLSRPTQPLPPPGAFEVIQNPEDNQASKSGSG